MGQIKLMEVLEHSNTFTSLKSMKYFTKFIEREEIFSGNLAGKFLSDILNRPQSHMSGAITDDLRSDQNVRSN